MTSAQSTKEELEHTVKRLEQDVALLKRENDILRKNQERSEREIQVLESVLDSIPDVIGIQLPDHTVLRYNKAGYDLVDLEPDELRNKKCFELVGRASPCASCATTDAVESGSMAAHELYFPELGKHLNCRATPVFNQKGEISHVVEMLQDISEQKRIEQELKEKEQKYRRVVETAVDGFWMVDSKGWIEDVNQAYADMSGYDMDELLGMHVSRLEAQENLKDVEEHMLKVMKKGSDRFESRHRRKDGSVFDVEVSTSFDPEDNGSFTSFVRDITDRLTSEQILRESEAHYRSVVRAAPIGIGVVVDRVFSQVNDKICDMVGFSRDELLGRSARLLYPSEEEYAFVGREKYRQMLEHGTGMVETRFQRKDGRVIDVLLSSAPLAEDSLVQGVTFTALDITGRKRHEEALRQSEIKFRNIFNTSNDAIFIHDMTGHFLEVNAVACERLGFGREELLEMRVMDIAARDPGQTVPEVIETIEQKGQRVFESRHRKKNGSEFPVEVSSRTIHFEGRPCILSLARDISDRRQAEEELRKSEKKFRKLMDLVPDMISIQDPDMNVVYSNWNGFGEVPEERRLIGGKCYRVYRGRDAICPDCQAKRVMETKEAFQKEVVIPGEIWLDLRVIPMLDDQGQVEFFLEWVRDITERKRSEFALAEAKREFESIFDNSLVGIMLLRAGRTVHRGNRRLADILGYDSPDEMAGMSMRQLHLSQERFEDYDRRFYATLAREDQIQIEYRLKRKDGSPVWCSLSGKALDPPDLDQGVIWILDELESRKALENDLMQAIELSEAANRAKSEFLANMSHEIRTPLNGVLGMLQVMQTTDLDQEQLEYVDMAITSSQRLTRLLSDILDLTKIEADKLEISEDVFSLPQVMQSIKDIFSHAARENENELGIACDEALSDSLIGDSTRLTQILFNLVGNALKYTKKGRVDVSVLHLPPAGKGLARILFSVADTGPGIADDKIDKVFEAFTQANSTSSPYIRQFEGAGLGLPLVKRLVGLMGGTISIASQVNKGTTVYVSLPFRIPEGLQSGSSDHPIELTSKNRSEFKVLAVDDDEATRLHVQRILERQGYRVHVAKDGEHALAQLAQSRFDCILMDVQMPVLDGVEATRLIRASKATFRHVPIIALTAYAMSGDREKFIAAGMDDYIAKPVSQDELLKTLKRNLPD